MTRLVKILAASVALAIVLGLASIFRPAFQPLMLGSKEAALFLTVAIGAGTYVGLLFGLKAVTLTEIKGAFRRAPALP